MADHLLRRLPALTNPWLLGLASAPAFAPEDARELRDLATAGGGVDGPDRERLDDLLASAVSVLDQINSAYFRFDVEGAVADDEPLGAELRPDRSTRAAGLGLTEQRSDRKLLAVVVVDVEGEPGDLVLAGTEKRVAPRPGLVVVVPAYASLELSGEAGAVAVVAFHAVGNAFR